MRARRLLLYLLLAGLLARVLYLRQVAELPFFQDPIGDSARYLERAAEILDGRLVGDRPFFYGGIFYPWLLAASRWLFGSSPYPVCLAQALAGCALAWVLQRFARKAGASPAISALAAGIGLFYGPFAFLEADLLMISWTLLFTMTGALLLLDGVERTRAPAILARLGAAGLCLGLAASERPNLIALVPVLAAWVLVFGPEAGRLRGAAALVAGSGAVILCVALMNHAASGRWVLLTTSSGINFYIGNHPGARGTFDEPWSSSDPAFTAGHTDLEEASLTMARRESGRDLDAIEAGSYWFSRGMAYLKSNPREAAWLYLRKLALFWNAAEIPNHLDFRFLRERAPALRLMPFTFGLVAPLGIYGLLSRRSRSLMTRPAATLLAALILVPMAGVLPFFVADRYRVAAVPPLIVSAAFGAAALGRGFSLAGTRRSAALHLACIVLAGAAMATPMTDFDQSRNYWLLAQAWKKQGRFSEAADAYALALEAAPAPGAAALIHNNRGVVLAAMGEPVRARQEYRLAIELSPDLVLPHRNLGLSLMEEGPSSASEAFAHLTVAERADEGDIDVARALAVLLLARGDPVAAGERAMRVLRRLPGDPSARAVLEKASPGAPP
ncbi:MAG TPA: hypothetical protein VGK94_00865 [Candidatus Polarisedimenticolia bacterium]|jgi:tetratricopeptide (TPR) repeat protein